MGFFSRIIGKRAEDATRPIQSYADFWGWFAEHQSGFHKIVQTKDSARIEQEIFAPLSASLEQIKDGFFFLVGMLDGSTAELVFTADGNPKNIVFVEELVAVAPALPGWQFTSLKQPAEGFSIRMNGVDFGPDSLGFYPVDHEETPDLVDVTVVHAALDDSNADWAKQGAYIFLDNFLGELNFLTEIDQLNFRGKTGAERDLIPIDALPNYLETRKALFAEKYDGVRIFTDNDNYSLLEAQLDGGRTLLATVNADLLGWDKKASHPWMLIVTIKFDGENNMGLPDGETGDKLNEIEDAISSQLKDSDGYLNIGRQTADSERNIFFACVDFREPSKVAYQIQGRYNDTFAIDYNIFKDKYWQSVSHLSA
jgi:hypothetical protein